MIVPIAMCLFFGKWLDEKFDTNLTFLFIFLILGVASSFRNLYVFVIKDYSDEQKKEEKNGYLVVEKDEENRDIQENSEEDNI